MTEILCNVKEQVLWITLNRIEKQNAFDEKVLLQLQTALDEAAINPHLRVIVLNANGRHFSAGADLAWMQRMAQYSESENLMDAKILARLMHTLHHCKLPTIAMVHGAAMGGGAGLVAACDMAIAAETAYFCFSEVTLGLVPAVISPYVVKAIGERAAAWLFMSAEKFDAQRALALQLIQHCVPEDELLTYTTDYAQRLARLAPEAVRTSKSLVRQVAGQPIDEALQEKTATLIAKVRVSPEGQRGLNAFLNKDTRKG